jgi:hypothetical protein
MIKQLLSSGDTHAHSVAKNLAWQAERLKQLNKQLEQAKNNKKTN